MDLIIENIGWIGLILTVTFVLLYKKYSKDPNAFTGKYSGEIIIENGADTNQESIQKAMENSGFKEIEFNEKEEYYNAKTKWTFWSFGEHVKIKYRKVNEKFLIDYLSICALPTQVVDWGKNKRNFLRFRKELLKLS